MFLDKIHEKACSKSFEDYHYVKSKSCLKSDKQTIETYMVKKMI